MDYSVAPPAEHVGTVQGHRASLLLIDATRKWAYPPQSLPTREHMDDALRLWQAAGLPELRLREPWYGRPDGVWTPTDREEAARAVRGDYHATGKRVAGERRES